MEELKEVLKGVALVSATIWLIYFLVSFISGGGGPPPEGSAPVVEGTAVFTLIPIENHPDLMHLREEGEITDSDNEELSYFCQ